MVRFVGSCHAKGADKPGGIFLTPDEIEKKAQSIVGSPILVEHDGFDLENGKIDKNKEIGSILAAWKDDKTGKLMIVGDIPKNKSPYSASIVEKIKKGDKKGLSLGIMHELNDLTLDITDHHIREVTVTEDPDGGNDTLIHYIEDDKPEFKRLKGELARRLRDSKLKNQTYKSNNTENSVYSQEMSNSDNNAASSVPVPKQDAPKEQKLSDKMEMAKHDLKTANSDFKEGNDFLDNLLNDRAALEKFVENEKNKKRKILEEQEESVLQYITSELLETELKPDQSDFFKAIKGGFEAKDTNLLPLTSFIASVASRNKKNSASVKEKELQALKSEKEKLSKEIEELRVNSKKQKIAEDFAPPKTAQPPQEQAKPDISSRFSYLKPSAILNTPIPIRPPERKHSLQYRDTDEAKSLRNAFMNIPKKIGMDIMDIQGIVGYDYGNVTKGVVSETINERPVYFADTAQREIVANQTRKRLPEQTLV
jgi:HPt (histidine-containing phosphotransfer) domain-containing protein